MRTSIAVLASLAALTTVAPAASADVRPLPDLPPVQCGVAGCPDPVAGTKECVANGVGALQNWLQGTPQPGTCDPLGRS